MLTCIGLVYTTIYVATYICVMCNVHGYIYNIYSINFNTAKEEEALDDTKPGMYVPFNYVHTFMTLFC